LPQLTNGAHQAHALNELANSYSLSGQPRRAVPLFEMQNALQEKLGDKKNLAIGLGNVADDQLKLGELAAAEGNLRREMELWREIEAPDEADSHLELGRVLAYQGSFGDADSELTLAADSYSKHGSSQAQCITWAYRALRALLMGEAGAALAAARRARELADIFHPGYGKIERDIIRTEWLLGAALISSMFQVSGSELRDTKAEPQRGTGNVEPETLRAAETHLTEALTRCRRINMVDHEPDILLAWARWYHAARHTDHARQDTQEALAIADRCEYRLKQAEIHNFLARLALEGGELEAAKAHATTAYERAWCDGPPHCYKPALDEAARMLKELRVEPPRL
jgi:hypothetical protein